jgi:hypothetical protein
MPMSWRCFAISAAICDCCSRCRAAPSAGVGGRTVVARLHSQMIQGIELVVSKGTPLLVFDREAQDDPLLLWAKPPGLVVGGNRLRQRQSPREAWYRQRVSDRSGIPGLGVRANGPASVTFLFRSYASPGERNRLGGRGGASPRSCLPRGTRNPARERISLVVEAGLMQGLPERAWVCGHESFLWTES